MTETTLNLNEVHKQLAAALRDCRMLARTSCCPHDLMAGIITHASKAVAECPTTVRKRHKFAAALRACIYLAYNCPRDELADEITKTVSNALAEYNPQQLAKPSDKLPANGSLSL